jgi:uncharacterized protein (DUF1800 family)
MQPLLRYPWGIAAGLFLAGVVSIPLPAEESVIPPTADERQIVHVLNRITFGPRPGDVEMVERMGLGAYIERQLHPETINDSAVDQELRQFDLLQMSSQELATLYFTERKLEQEKKRAEAQQQAAMENPAGNTTAAPADVPPPAPGAGGGMMERMKANRSVAAIAELEDAKLIRAADSQRQLQEVLVDFWSNHFNIDMKKGPCRVLKVADDREVIRPNVFGRFRDMLEASARSPAMLFYLDNAENSAPRQVSPMERQMQAAYMQKNFGVDAPPLSPGGKQGGVNENYAREIMELHTLGVDGGYTQKDVQEVARCFTGWTLNRQTGEFMFTPRRHDNGEKIVLGHEIPPYGGMKDGEMVLDILASAPATAHFISRELCQRFVADDPPEALVQRIAQVFQATGGDLRQVTKAILTSPEFLSPSSFQNKIKSPLEFAVSAVRATASAIAENDPPPFNTIRFMTESAGVLGRAKAADRLSQAKRQSLNWHVYELGEPLFACTPPTGYKEVSKIWVSPGALIERLNFALALTQQQVRDVRFDSRNVLANVDLDKPDAVLDQCAATLLQGNITPGTRKVLAQAALPPPGQTGQTVDSGKLIALLLGSPEFQRK